MKLPYREGTWFAIPLRDTGYGAGIVARHSPGGCILLGYLFGPRRVAPPLLTEVQHLLPGDAILVGHMGDLSLIRGEWPIIGQHSNWRRNEWPVPQAIRRDEVSRTAWRVTYSDADLSVIRETPEDYNNHDLARDSLMGAGAVELRLTKLLAT